MAGMREFLPQDFLKIRIGSAIRRDTFCPELDSRLASFRNEHVLDDELFVWLAHTRL